VSKQYAPRDPFLVDVSLWARRLCDVWEEDADEQIEAVRGPYVGALSQLNRHALHYPRHARAALKAIGAVTLAGLILLRSKRVGGPYALCFKKFLRSRPELEGGVRLLL